MIHKGEVPNSLQHLHLKDMSLPTASFRSILGQSQRLRDITLLGCTFDANQFLDSLTSLVNLTSLQLRKCQISASSASKAIESALALPQMYAFVLEDCSSNEAYVRASRDEACRTPACKSIPLEQSPLVVLDIGALAIPSAQIEVLTETPALICTPHKQ